MKFYVFNMPTTPLFSPGSLNKMSIISDSSFTLFKVASGLAINYSKSCLIGIGMDKNKCSLLSSIMGCSKSTLPFKYLGFALHFNKPWRSNWAFLKQKVEKKLEAWKGSFLSLAGRLTLVNGVLDAILVYWMFIYEIPLAIIQHLESIRRRFLWRGHKPYHGSHSLVSWDKVCRPKRLGGLGVINIKTLNHYLLAKWG